MSQSQGSIEQMHLFGDYPVSNTEKLKCLQRELTLRRKVYAKMVKDGRMNPHTAAHEIRVMAEIVSDYERHGP